MADSDSTPSPPSAPLSQKNENLPPISSKIPDLNEPKTELLNRIQGLKKDMQEWRLKLDAQVKVYHDELSELKKTLNVEVEQLRSEFQELRTTLQQQQDDVTTNLSSLVRVEDEEKTCQTEDEDSKTKIIDAGVQEVPKTEEKAEVIQN